MPTGAFHVAYNYEFYVEAGTTASTVPTASTGLTRVYSMSNASIKGKSKTLSATDYETGLGGARKLVTEVEYEIACEMNISLADEGYAIMHNAFLDAPTGVLLRWYRVTPVFDASGDDPETYAGLAFVSGFDKDEEAGKIATVKFTLEGYGAMVWTQQAA
jgi:hypothetical protein